MKKIILSIVIILCLVSLAGVLTACSNDTHEHVWDKYVDYDAGYHYKVCTENYSHIEKECHHFDEGTIITNATETATGYIEYKCIECNRKKVEKIPMLGDTNYCNKVVDEKYLKTKISDATSIYYMSSNSGTYGDDDYIFEHTVIPSEYTEVEYIESNGTLYIDTGIVAKSGIDSEIKYSLDSIEGVQCILGARVGVQRFWGLVISYSKYEMGYNDTFISQQSTSIGKIEVAKTHLYTGEQYLKINGRNILTNNQSFDVNLDTNMYLFGANYEKRYYAYAKMYYCKIWDNGTLVRNFIPVIRDKDGIAGLYDIVNEVFYTASNDNGKSNMDNFNAGDIVVKDASLPEEYTQVAYIETDGTQYIDTDFIPDPITTRYETDISFNNVTGTMEVFGSRNGNAACPSSCNIFLVDGRLRLDWVNADKTTFVSVEKDKRYCISITANYAKINDEVIIDEVKGREPSEYSFYIGALNNHGNGVFRFSSCKIYSAKLYDNDTLVRDFIPAVRNDDNVAGLYDVANGKFYEKATGNDLLFENAIIGRNDNIPDEYDQLEYVESTGTQYIDTGYCANQNTKMSVDVIWLANSMNYQSVFGASLGDEEWTGFGYLGPYVEYNTYDTNLLSLEANVKNNIMLDKNNFYLNNNLEYTFDTGEFTTNKIYLFAFNSNNIAQTTNCMIFGTKIYNDDVLIFDFIPCRRKSDGIVGMYDIVGNAFYANSSQSIMVGENFIAGSDVAQNEYLPEEYRSISYIETTGTQYIDTGIKNEKYIIYDCKFEVIDVLDNYLYGANQQSSMMYNALYTNSKYEGNYTTYDFAASDFIEIKQKISQGQIVTNINDEEFAFDTATPNADEILIFACNDGNRPYGGKARCYYFKIYSNNVLIRDFVPCYRVSDGVVGLYDLVYCEFYANATTTKNKDEIPNFKTGNKIGHSFDDGVEIKNATFDEEGLIEYTCKNCDKHLYETINKLAYSINFEIDDGVECVRVYNSIDPNDYENTLSTYSRNKSTFNYSTIKGVVMFEVILKEGYVISKVSNCAVTKKGNIYTSAYIVKDTKIVIKTKKS